MSNKINDDLKYLRYQMESLKSSISSLKKAIEHEITKKNILKINNPSNEDIVCEEQYYLVRNLLFNIVCNKVAINTRTQEEYNALMIACKGEGLEWIYPIEGKAMGMREIGYNTFAKYKEKTCVAFYFGNLCCGSIEDMQECNYEIASFDDYDIKPIDNTSNGLNAVVRCVDSDECWFTKGNCYKVENGKLTTDWRDKTDGYFTSIEEINTYLHAEFELANKNS